MKRLTSFAGVRLDSAEGCPVEPTKLSKLLFDHGIVAIEGCALSVQGLAELSASLGSVVAPPFLHEAEQGTGVTVLEHRVQSGDFDTATHVVFASGWHSDWTFLPQPPTVSMLYCAQAPDVGGDTLFCDSRAALTSLSKPFATFLRSLTVVHSSDVSYSTDSSYGKKDLVGVRLRPGAAISTTHNLVSESAIDGAECLLASPAYTVRVLDLTRPESDAILDVVYSSMFTEENIVRLSWAPGMLVIWDNYRFLHRALNQGITGTRRLFRSNVIWSQ